MTPRYFFIYIKRIDKFVYRIYNIDIVTNGDWQLMKYAPKKCKECGKEFVPTCGTQLYCKGPHTTYCKICGKLIEYTCSPREKPKCCSQSCINERKRRTVFEKYGVDNVNQLKSVKDKISQKNSSEEVRNRRQQTCLERYGVDNVSKSEEVKAKIQATMIDRYGESNAMQIQKFKDKYDWDSIVNKRCNTMMERYGVTYSLDIPEVKQRVRDIHMKKYGVPYYVMTDDYRHPTRSNVVSKINQQFSKDLMCQGINNDLEFAVGDKVYDIHISNSNILIEINPTYTHNSFGNHWNKEGLKSNYHLWKTKNAELNNYKCIHIFDWDNIEAIINQLLLEKTTTYARNCSIRIIDSKTVVDFESLYHLQGSCKGQSVCFGLYDDTQLIQIMTFGKPRYNRNYQWELLRLCTKSGYRIVGGASKLFTYFIKNYNPTSIISYCDRSKFTGNIYKKLGMKLHHTTDPAKIWSKGAEKVTDNLLRQRGFDQLFGTNYGKGTSNENLMLDHGWLPVYDCGQSVYEWLNR